MDSIKAVVFDLDGTLLDTLEDLADSANYALERFGLATRSLSEIRSFVGNGVYMLMKRAAGDVDETIVRSALDVFRARYAENCENKTKPYDGVIELLCKLKRRGIKTAVASNKFDGAVKQLCAKYFGGYIAEAVGEREGIARKPCPDSVFEALRRLDVKPDEAVYVGDSDVDIATAKNAGMRCISVGWGFKTREQLAEAGAADIVDSAAEILRKLG